MGFNGNEGALYVSVAKGVCPLLFSRPALSQLGATMDFAKHTISVPSLGLAKKRPSMNKRAHYLIELKPLFSFRKLYPHARRLAENFPDTKCARRSAENFPEIEVLQTGRADSSSPPNPGPTVATSCASLAASGPAQL